MSTAPYVIQPVALCSCVECCAVQRSTIFHISFNPHQHSTTTPHPRPPFASHDPSPSVRPISSPSFTPPHVPPLSLGLSHTPASPLSTNTTLRPRAPNPLAPPAPTLFPPTFAALCSSDMSLTRRRQTSHSPTLPKRKLWTSPALRCSVVHVTACARCERGEAQDGGAPWVWHGGGMVCVYAGCIPGRSC